MYKPPVRELTARGKRAIRKLVVAECANYDNEYECLSLHGTFYMFTTGFNTSGLCRCFQNAVLPLDSALATRFAHRPAKACKQCGWRFTLNGRQTYCSHSCADTARRKTTAARVRKHRDRSR